MEIQEISYDESKECASSFLENFIFADTKDEQRMRNRTMQAYCNIIMNMQRCFPDDLWPVFSQTMSKVKAANNFLDAGSFYRAPEKRIYFNASTRNEIEKQELMLVHEFAHAIDFAKGMMDDEKYIPISYLDGIYVTAKRDAKRMQKLYFLPKENSMQYQGENPVMLKAKSKAFKRVTNFITNHIWAKEILYEKPETKLISEVLSGYYGCSIGTGGHGDFYWQYAKESGNFDITYSTEIFAVYIVMLYFRRCFSYEYNSANFVLVNKYLPETMYLLDKLIHSI